MKPLLASDASSYYGAAPALSLVKTADPLTYSAVDQTISYSYVIKNTGNVTLSGPFTVTDDKATVTCTQPADAALSPTRMTCTASYTITPGRPGRRLGDQRSLRLQRHGDLTDRH